MSPGEEVSRRLLTAWNDRDVEGFRALLADDVEWYDPAMPEPPPFAARSSRASTSSTTATAV